MISVVTMILSRIGGSWIKYALVAAMVAGAFFYVRNMGVQSERAKWVQASLIEEGRQLRINEVWVQKSVFMADVIADQLVMIDTLNEQARKGADNEADIDTLGLSANGVMRLNTIR